MLREKGLDDPISARRRYQSILDLYDINDLRVIRCAERRSRLGSW